MAAPQPPKLTALLVEDDRDALEALAALVAMEGFRTVMVRDLATARKHIEKEPPDVVLLDVNLPDGQGHDLLAELAEEGSAEVIMVTGQASVETAVQALRLGAYDYLTKPVDIGRLKTLLARLRSTRDLKREVVTLRSSLRELGRFGQMVGVAPAMQRVYDLMEKVGPTDATVFLIGESGTGKEVAAQTLHQLSRRRDATYLALNCGAISETLIESELFGHERGSFTGAAKQHQGHFERCSGGTIFLDEITEMPMEAQVKLLRVLESGRVLRVGGTREIEVDVRVIAATNRDPEQAVEEGKLRKDLYYRLKVFPIELPALRDRQGDIEPLSSHFLGQLNRRHETTKVLDPAALEKLETWHWPGNVRELKNVLERAYILADSVIGPSELPAEITGEAAPRGPSLHIRVGTSLDEIEQRVILATLDQLEGDKKTAAETLGVSLKTLYNRLKVYEGRD
ncbi:MAG: sigma-54-dependent Fis family transcriptional regulator [Acidobacteria bacterium]|nr:sigma-54-dependent Fis family transcriptional regulator [Acidobacteriota bacterium]